MSGHPTEDHPLPGHVLLPEFLALLAHELRAPLSVLSNDLAYLSAKYQNEDLRTSTQSLRRAAELISPLDSLLTNKNTVIPWLLSELLSELSDYLVLDAELLNKRAKLALDLKSTSSLLRMLFTHLTHKKISATIDQSQLVILIEPKDPPIPSSASFHTLCFPLNSGAAPSSIALSELLLTLSGARISIESGHLTISLPYDSSQSPDR